MKCAICAALAAAGALCCAAARGADAAPRSGAGGDEGGGRALGAVEKILRGERVDESDLKNLGNTVVRIDAPDNPGGIGAGRGGESGAGPAAGPRNVYILRFDSEAGGERQVQVLRIQREILKNQLVLLKSLSAIAGYQVSLGTRTARVENIMRDMTLGMKSSGGELKKIAGDAAGTSSKMTDVAATTADMAAGMREMSRNIGEIEGAIDNVDSMIRRLASSVESQGDDMLGGMRKMGRDIESRVDASAVEVRDRDDRNTKDVQASIDAVGGALSSQISELEPAQ